jgi:DNA-binding MarR family transcriptional regulator
MLSEAPARTLRMTSLAQRTNATLPRLSHVVRRLEDRDLVERFPCPEDGRATNARLTSAGWDTVVDAAPGHVNTVRELVLDPLSPSQLAQLRRISDALLTVLDPSGHMTRPPGSAHADHTS